MSDNDPKTPPAPAPEPTEAQLLAALGRMDKRKLREILGSAPAQATPKIGPVLESLSPGEIELARSSLSAAVKQLAEKGDSEADSMTFADLPEQLVQAMRSSSAYRGKNLAHSVRIAARWIAEKRPPKQ